MGHVLEISLIGPYRVFFEQNRDSRKRDYYSAHIELESEKLILDDRILPRLKKTISEVLRYWETRATA